MKVKVVQGVAFGGRLSVKPFPGEVLAKEALHGRQSERGETWERVGVSRREQTSSARNRASINRRRFVDATSARHDAGGGAL